VKVMSTKQPKQGKPSKQQTPTFLLELPLQVEAGQAKRLRAHLEAGRQFYNALLSEGQRRLRQMRADPGWQAARSIPRSRKQERHTAFLHLREQHGFSEYGLHEAAKRLRTSWLGDHLDAVLAQTLATRAYRALNRVCLGVARRVRFKSRTRGLSSLENKRNDTGMRFVLQKPEEGHHGFLLWAANPDNYDEKRRIKKGGKQKLVWKTSKGYQATRRRKERKLAAHRKSLHGRKVHELVAVGNTLVTEKLSYTGWQKQYGKSVGLRAPGMFIEMLRRTVASTGGTLHEIPTRSTKLSQYCHGCEQWSKKPLSQRWHQCACGIGPVQRDLYSAFLAAYLDPADPIPSCAKSCHSLGRCGGAPAGST